MSGVATPDGRAARVSLVNEHLLAENAHELDAVMATFSQDAIFNLNGLVMSDQVAKNAKISTSSC